MKKLLIAITILLATVQAYSQDSTHTKFKKWASFEKVRNSRYITTDEIGSLIGFSAHASGKYFFTYQTVNGWQFERHVYAGFGTGIEVAGKNGVLLNEGNSTACIMVPLFGEIRATFLNKRVSPFFSEKVGYDFYITGPTKYAGVIGGAMGQTQVGIKAFITQQSAFNLSVGYRLQALAIPNVYAAQFSDFQKALPGETLSVKTTEYYNFFMVMVGFTY